MRHKPRIVLEPSLPATSWPSRADAEAFHGPAGEYVLELEPETEADPHAVLIILLTAFSNVIGRALHFMVGRTRHALTLYSMVVGRTASGRKGTAKEDALYPLRDADPTWPPCVNGLSSGEGLIDAVRDPAETQPAMPTPDRAVEDDDQEDDEPRKSKKRTVQQADDDAQDDDAQDEQETREASTSRGTTPDTGVSDKRLFAVETEAGAVLTRMRRDGNSLSSVIRAAWDGERVLRTLTKHSKLKATDAHISIVAQITHEELQGLLRDADVFNGFANRFLWVCSQRAAHRLPDGGNPNPVRLQKRILAIVKAVRFARRISAEDGRLTRSRAAEKRWAALYEELTSARPGLFGAATSRADAYVVRLSCLYALLDCSMTVEVQHLDAAHALWRYCEASARHLFNASTGNSDADRVLTKVRAAGAAGLTRDEIRRQVFAGHRTSAELFTALVLLRDGGFINERREPTSGRPRERWVAL